MRKLKCFVIMPSGKNLPTRLVPDSKNGLVEAASSQAECDNEIKVEFNKVYKRIVEKAMLQVNASQKEATIEWHNSDTLPGGGNLIPNLVKAICCADITITDLTGLNPNVLFELGIRLSVRDSLNILLGHKGVILPFDIFTQDCIDYALDVDSGDTAADNIAKKIQQGMPALLENALNTADNLFRRTVEAATGRHLERSLTEALAPAPDLLIELVNELQRERAGDSLRGTAAIQTRADLRNRTWEFLETLAKMLQDKPDGGQDRAIEIYRIMTKIEGYRDRRQKVYLKLHKIFAAATRTAEAEEYLQKAIELES